MSFSGQRSSSGSAGLLDEIYRRLDPLRLYQKLELQERGRRFIGRCPGCGKRELYVLRYDPRYPGLRARCNRANQCGYAVSAWDYLRDVEGIPEDRIFRTLAERAGVELRELTLKNSETYEANWKRRERRAMLYEAFWTWAQERLWSEAKHGASEEARTVDFLVNRRYSEAISRGMGLGFLPPTDQTRAYLLGLEKFTPEDLHGAEFLDPAFDRKNDQGERLYTLAIPYPEQLALIARVTVSKSNIPTDVPKYRYPKGLKLEAPAYMRSIDRKRPAIVVEGFLDAALAHALADGVPFPADSSSTSELGHRSVSEAEVKNLGNGTCKNTEAILAGMGQFVATGTNRLNAAQIAALQMAGVREVVLSFDSDGAAATSGGAGEAGTLATLDRLAEAGTFFPRVLRIPAASGCKDPDEVLTRHGIAGWAEVLENHTYSEARFRADVLLRRAGLPETLVQAGSEALPHPPAAQRDAILAGLAELAEREAVRPHRVLFLQELTGLLAAALGFDAAGLTAALEPFRQRAALKRRAEALRAAALAVPGWLAALEQELAGATPETVAAQLTEAENTLRTGLETAQALGGGAAETLEPVRLSAYTASLAAREEVLSSPFARLDEAASIHPGRITLVAARPSHGKTTFLVNLLVHWLKTYPERSFVFFSYDGPREQLLSQLVSRLTRRHALREIEAAIRGDAQELDGHPERVALEAQTRAALRWLETCGAEKRLFLVDRALTARELDRSVRALASGGRLGAVIVDYIQQVRPGNGKKFETRQREVGYVSRTLQALAQETGVPVVAAAQLNRLSEGQGRTDRPRLWQLREAGDLEQDATTVYGLYNHHQALSESFGSDEAPAAASVSGALGVWHGGPVLGAARSAPGSGRKRGRAHGGKAPDAAPAAVLEEGSPDLLEAELRAERSLGASSRWIVPNALRAVPLDVEVLKAKHGRTHTRVALTYDLVANYITDGRSDGPPEV